MGCSKAPANVGQTLISTLIALLSIAIVVYTATQLSDITVDPTPENNDVGNVVKAQNCIINQPQGGDATTEAFGFTISTNNCLMLEILGGCTIALGIIVALLQCFTCNCCGIGGLVDALLALAGLVVWIAAAVLVALARNDYQELDASSPTHAQDDRRDVIFYMCWVMVGLFGLLLLTAFLKCCLGRRNKKAEKLAEEMVASGATVDDAAMVAPELLEVKDAPTGAMAAV